MLRSQVRKRAFKVAILLLTALTVAAILATSPTGRFGVNWALNRIRWGVRAIIGLRSPRAEIEAERSQRRWLNVAQTRTALAETAAAGGPRIDGLLKATRMDPARAVIRWGNFDGTLVLSSDVFEPDDTGRSYRFVPLTRSVWVIGLTLNRVMCQFQVLDTPEAREALAAVQGVIVPESVQTTSSWGCRGVEPDTKASLRGIVLGDSVIQGCSSVTSKHRRLVSNASWLEERACAPRCSTREFSVIRRSSITIPFCPSSTECPRIS